MKLFLTLLLISIMGCNTYHMRDATGPTKPAIAPLVGDGWYRDFDVKDCSKNDPKVTDEGCTPLAPNAQAMPLDKASDPPIHAYHCSNGVIQTCNPIPVDAPIDVPPIEEKVLSTESCSYGIWTCTWIRYTCSDKTRFLMTSEDGTKHCIRIAPEKTSEGPK
jgi:hypothetical protein